MNICFVAVAIFLILEIYGQIEETNYDYYDDSEEPEDALEYYADYHPTVDQGGRIELFDARWDPCRTQNQYFLHHLVPVYIGCKNRCNYLKPQLVEAGMQPVIKLFEGSKGSPVFQAWVDFRRIYINEKDNKECRAVVRIFFAVKITFNGQDTYYRCNLKTTYRKHGEGRFPSTLFGLGECTDNIVPPGQQGNPIIRSGDSPKGMTSKCDGNCMRKNIYNIDIGTGTDLFRIDRGKLKLDFFDKMEERMKRRISAIILIPNSDLQDHMLPTFIDKNDFISIN